LTKMQHLTSHNAELSATSFEMQGYLAKLKVTV
jgi:hypothetical protein